MKKRIVSLICSFIILFGCVSPLISFATATDVTDTDGALICENDIPLRLHYDEPSPVTSTENSSYADSGSGSDVAWEQYSLPIGNGYFGANVFGRTETERIQISEKTVSNRYFKDANAKDRGGLNSFSETYIDFGHTSVSDYTRYLDMKTAISGVEYTSGGVKYSREYFTSYPDKALVIRLDADTVGALSFTLRPTVPYEQEYMVTSGDGYSKSGEVRSFVGDNGIGYVELSGKLEYYDVDFLGIYKVYANGGTVTASTTVNADGDTDGTIKVSGANSAYIVVTLGTDYVLSSEVFTADDKNKPTFKTDLDDTRAKVEAEMEAIDVKIAGKSFEDAYNTLKDAHIDDYSELFGRVTLDLGCDPGDFNVTTDALLESYKSGYKSTYLEVLMFQYGRYLLIASSRSGALPAHLQGAWNTYNTAPWSSGYWHNINVQMNYWPVFSTNLAEMFEPYVEYNDAYMSKAEQNATANVSAYNPNMLGKDGGNGWVIGVANHPFSVSDDRSSGNLGFTTQLYWDYYQFTKDEAVLKKAYEILSNAARYITKCVELDENGNYLVSYCDSPEVHVDGIWYYTKGTTYAQTFAYLNNYYALETAKTLGVDLSNDELLSSEEYSILMSITEQLDRYDPINVGLSGQIKEFREEDYYGTIGDDPDHRHMSQLVGLYPGDLINSKTPAWLDAALVSLEGRKDNAAPGGWIYAHKIGLYARTKSGDYANTMLEQLLKRSTFPNLFTKLWTVFQIDSSFGATAGISEMLLQSHEGYIEPLAAIPSSWNNGSYTGLMARGNFEVSAAWENGVANTFNILSNRGGEVSVKYPSIENAKVVRASDGKIINFSVSEKDVITFDTESGETYIISNFTSIEIPSAPEVINYSRSGFEEFNLSWTSSENAAAYNVYVAIENDSDYTLIATTESNYASYVPSDKNKNSRMTFAVTAVNVNGNESNRTLCYYNPEDTAATVEKISAEVTKDLELQVIVKANGNAVKYRLYEMSEGSSEYALIDESGFPILYTNSYDSTSDYAVSVISYYNAEESKLIKITDFAGAPIEYNAKNIFEGKTFIQASGAQYNPISGYEYSKLTDGIIDTVSQSNGRFSSSVSSDTVTKSAAATIELKGTYVLSELRFFVFDRLTKHLGTNFTLEVYSNGEWISIVKNLTNKELLQKHVKTIGTEKKDYFLSFDLGLINATKIRFSVDAISGTTVTWYEAECTGILLDEKYAYCDNILSGKEFIGSESTYVHAATGDTYGYEKLTDGIISSTSTVGRFSSNYNGKMNGTVDLGGIYKLNKLRMYHFNQSIANIGQNLKIETFFEGEWSVAAHIPTNTELRAYIVSDSTSIGGAWFEFDFDGAFAERIRITTDTLPNGWITFYEIQCSGTLIRDFGEYHENIIANKQFVPAENTTVHSSAYGYQCLTDGIFETNVGRFSSKSNSFAEATVDLGGEYYLSEIRFYDFVTDTSYSIDSPTHAGDNFTLEVYSDGKWVTVVKYETVNELQAHRVKTSAKGAGNGWLAFDAGNIKAEKIRFYAKGASIVGGYVTYYEIECSAYETEKGALERNSYNALLNKSSSISPAYDEEFNILVGKDFVPTDTALSSVYGSSFGYSTLTDGTYTTRLSSKQNGMAQATVDLGDVYTLSSLRIKYYNNNTFVGAKFAINLYYNGNWRTVVDCQDNSSIMKYALNGWLIFDLTGEIAEKIEFVIPSTTNGGYVSFYEIECSGSKLSHPSISGGKAANNANDGNFETYTEVSGSASYSLTIDLENKVPLYSLKIYELIDCNNLVDGIISTASNDTAVEIYRDGLWIRIADGISLDPNALYTEINLYGTECSRIRILFNNTRLFDSETEYRAAKICEVSCTKGYVPSSLCDLANVFKQLTEVNISKEAHKEKMELYKEQVTSFEFVDKDLSAYIAQINEYYVTVKKNIVSAVNFVLKTSVTLDKNLIINVYIPEKSLVNFTFDGIEYTEFSALEKHIVDGEAYYRVSKTLAAAEAANEISLIVTVNSDGNNVTGRFTISIQKYAAKILENGTKVEKQLVSDILSYVRAACVYFEPDNTKAVSDIDAIIGKDYDAFSPYNAEGSTEAVSGFESVTFALTSTPSIRFYLTSGADESAYSFKINESAVPFTVEADEDGKYVKLDIYAYRMCETVDCYYNGNEIGSYHIASYHEWAKTQNDTALVNLVERFWKYCQSAREYKNSVAPSQAG